MQAKNWIPVTEIYLNNVEEEIISLSNKMMFETADTRSLLRVTEYLQTGSAPRGSNQENEKKEIKKTGNTENEEIFKSPSEYEISNPFNKAVKDAKSLSGNENVEVIDDMHK